MYFSEGPTTSYWLQFFLEAGIPSSDATNYAITFSENRIKEEMLPDLNKEILNDLDIKLMGDVIAILKHAKEEVSQVGVEIPITTYLWLAGWRL